MFEGKIIKFWFDTQPCVLCVYWFVTVAASDYCQDANAWTTFYVALCFIYNGKQVLFLAPVRWTYANNFYSLHIQVQKYAFTG